MSENELCENGSLNVPIEHHPTIRYMVYNGYCKVMSNIPKMGHLPTPVHGVSAVSWHAWGGACATPLQNPTKKIDAPNLRLVTVFARKWCKPIFRHHLWLGRNSLYTYRQNCAISFIYCTNDFTYLHIYIYVQFSIYANKICGTYFK